MEDVTGSLEARLIHPNLTGVEFTNMCHQVVGLGMAAVLCRPDMVATAAAAVKGSRVAVATAVDFHRPGQALSSRARLRATAQGLVDQGADELGIVITGDSLRHG